MSGSEVVAVPAFLRVAPLRFEFEATDPIWFPPGKAANIFRGAFGEIFRQIACVADCPGAKSCSQARDCAYARMFEPRDYGRTDVPATGDHPSGFEDRPRPFVLRAASLDGHRFEPGERFILEVNVFDPAIPALEYFRLAFEHLGRQGLGPGRPLIELLQATELPVVDLPLAARADPVGKIRVTFLTPAELKSGGEVLREPRFDALFRRARDRVTSLMGLYQFQAPLDQPEMPDFRGMGVRASAISMTRADIHQAEAERRSGRTGQRHSLGGFTGVAEYEGELTEFLPYLEAGWWTGVGRLTVWGNGQIRAEPCI